LTPYEKASKTEIQPKKEAQARLSSSDAHPIRQVSAPEAQEKRAPPLERIMKKEQRIRKPSDFRKAYKEGRRFLSPHFVLYVRRNNLPHHARIGVSISKGQFKLATRRNRLRRIVKESFRKGMASRGRGYDFVVASRPGRRSSDIKQAARELQSLVSG